MNMKKTETRVISRYPKEQKLEITVNRVVLLIVNIFKYLGTLIIDNEKTETEIEARTKLAKSQLSTMSKRCPQKLEY